MCEQHSLTAWSLVTLRKHCCTWLFTPVCLPPIRRFRLRAKNLKNCNNDFLTGISQDQVQLCFALATMTRMTHLQRAGLLVLLLCTAVIAQDKPPTANLNLTIVTETSGKPVKNAE